MTSYEKTRRLLSALGVTDTGEITNDPSLIIVNADQLYAAIWDLIGATRDAPEDQKRKAQNQVLRLLQAGPPREF